MWLIFYPCGTCFLISWCPKNISIQYSFGAFIIYFYLYTQFFMDMRCTYLVLRVLTLYYMYLPCTTCTYLVQHVLTLYYVYLPCTTCTYLVLCVFNLYYVYLPCTTCTYLVLRALTLYNMYLPCTTCTYLVLHVLTLYYTYLPCTMCTYLNHNFVLLRVWLIMMQTFQLNNCDTNMTRARDKSQGMTQAMTQYMI